MEGAGQDDQLDGGPGTNILIGGAGSDTATYFDQGGVTVNLSIAGAQNTIGAGTDTLIGIENLTGSGFNDTLSGDAGANVLQGLAGNDVLNGKAGADTMVGGLGNDIYVVDEAGDVVTESAGEGSDMVVAKASYGLGAGVSVEILTTIDAAATTAMNLTGNELARPSTAMPAPISSNGGGGADGMVGVRRQRCLIVDNAGDEVSESAGRGSDIVYRAGRLCADRRAVASRSCRRIDWAATNALNLTGNELANIDLRQCRRQFPQRRRRRGHDGRVRRQRSSISSTMPATRSSRRRPGQRHRLRAGRITR